MALDLRPTDGGLTLRVRVQPRASKDALGGEREGALVGPADGTSGRRRRQRGPRAFPGKKHGVAPSSVRVVSGASGRNKVVSVAGLDPATAR